MTQKTFKCIALIPARSGSKRIKNKNIKLLGNHPLIAYTIACVLQAKIFSRVIVSTDSQTIADIATYYGAEVPFMRPSEYAMDTSPDIQWVKYTLKRLKKEEVVIEDCFSILRPTNPFRTPAMIIKAWEIFLKDRNADSLRAISLCRQHPAKMWFISGNRMRPVLKRRGRKIIPWHDQPYCALPEIYAQNASLEIAWTRLPLENNTISGTEIIPYITNEFEGYDINDEKDWIYAQYLLKEKRVKLPQINQKPYILSPTK